jgi:hypothetical protein
MGIPTPPLDKKYGKGRANASMPVNFSIPREAVRLLRQYTADSPRQRGLFIGRLIFAYDAQQGFRGFLEENGLKELQKLCRQVRKDMRESEA